MLSEDLALFNQAIRDRARRRGGEIHLDATETAVWLLYLEALQDDLAAWEASAIPDPGLIPIPLAAVLDHENVVTLGDVRRARGAKS